MENGDLNGLVPGGGRLGGSRWAWVAPPLMVAGLVACAAVSLFLLPPPVGLMAVLLAGVVALLGLRLSLAASLAASLIATLGLAISQLYVGTAEANPWAALSDLPSLAVPETSSAPGLWLPVIPVAALIFASGMFARVFASALADLTTRRPPPDGLAEPPSDGLAEPPSDGLAEPPSDGLAEPPASPGAHADLSSQSPVRGGAGGSAGLTLALIAVGAADPAGEGGASADDSTAMRRLDSMILAGLEEAVSICKYGPRERLIVVSNEQAATLETWTALVSHQIGRQTRLASVRTSGDEPHLGASLRQLSKSLDLPQAGHDALGFLTQVALAATKREDAPSAGAET